MPLLPILVLGGLAFVAYAATRPSHPQPPQPSGARPTSPEEAALRAQIFAAVSDLLQNGQDPASMEAVAVAIEPYGFTNEAAGLRARAAQLRANR
jgi:hypothetical protein